MTKMKNINISLTNNSYDIHIGKDLSNEVPKLIAPFMNRRKIFIVCDENIGSIILPKIKQPLLEEGYEVFVTFIKANEDSKSFKILEKTISELLNNGIERNDTLIAVGGGVIGDLSGFISSIIYRGINFVQIPTTLLAQVDSSVGGKTAINVVQGKNLVGSFYQPKTVITDIDFLSSLTKREIKCGLSEIIKYGIICDKDFFYWLDENAKDLLMLNEECLIYAIKKSCLMKAHIVQKDERETGERALLNFGHTFGHAYEATLNYSKKLNHGEGVLLGIFSAIKLSKQLKLLNNKDYKLVLNHLSKLDFDNLRKFFKKKDLIKIVNFMVTDKKNTTKKINFITLKKIGRVKINSQIDIPKVKKFIKDVLLK